MTSFKPLLADICEDITKLRYPLLVSPKLDGIRCVKLGGKALTRKLKPIPNDFVRTWVEANLPDGIDGELMLRSPKHPQGQTVEIPEGTIYMPAFSEVSSAIMSKAGEPDFLFNAFDYFGSCDDSLGFQDRFEILGDLSKDRPVLWQGIERLVVVPHIQVETPAELQEVVDSHVDLGYEGSMVRAVHGRYKFGRSTVKEGILLKIKSFLDEEAVVVGVVEQMHNTNEATRDNLGNVKRSSAKEGKVGTGKLGALVCLIQAGENTVKFEIGTGFTDPQRIEIWKEADGPNAMGIIGRLVKFKHQPPPGGRKPTEAPRFPVFLGWRED